MKFSEDQTEFGECNGVHIKLYINGVVWSPNANGIHIFGGIIDA